jgi:NADP-dependent 3-hydroxy acid dehydrogenase YdfG
MNAPSSLDGHVALVTGASSGLGRAAALALARLGATVALVARTEPDIRDAANEIQSGGRRATALACDLADAEGLARVVGTVRDELGPIHVLVNAAGTDVPGPVSTLSVEEWDRVIAVNLRAVFLLSRLTVPDMIEAGHGTIINVSSVAGKRGWANASAYCASKFALTGFTQALGAEVRPYGVRACVIYPGAMATNWGAWSSQERTGARSTTSPSEALAPDTVAELVGWIATAPRELVLDEVVVTPLAEQGYP